MSTATMPVNRVKFSTNGQKPGGHLNLVRVKDGKTLEVKKPGIYSVWVTPELAQYWLDHFNVGNRRLKHNAIEDYENQMRSGVWVENHPFAILFSSAGRLIDGQHRLHALVASGLSFWIRVECGLDDKIRQHVDTGRVRNLEDLIEICDDKSQNRRACSVIKAWHACTSSGSQIKMSAEEGLKFYRKHRKAIDWYVTVFTNEKCIGRAQIAAAVLEYWEQHQSKAEKFWKEVTNKMTTCPQAQLLRDYLIKTKFVGGQLGQKETYGKTITACRHHANGTLWKRLHASTWDSTLSGAAA